MLLAQFPGLDGGKQGHWGNQNESGAGPTDAGMMQSPVQFREVSFTETERQSRVAFVCVLAITANYPPVSILIRSD